MHTAPPNANTTINRYLCRFGTISLFTTGRGSIATATSVAAPKAELKNHMGTLGRQRPGWLRCQKKSTGQHRKMVMRMVKTVYTSTTVATIRAEILKVRMLPKTWMHCDICVQSSEFEPYSSHEHSAHAYDRELRRGESNVVEDDRNP